MPLYLRSQRLALVPKVFDAVNVIFFIGKALSVVDAQVMEFRNIQHIVTAIVVSVDNTIRLDFTS